MTENRTTADPQFLNNAMTSFIQIGGVLLLLSWCFRIISPFVNVVAWGLIISVAIYPLHLKLAGALGGRMKTSAAIIVLIGLASLLIPAWAVAGSTVDSLSNVVADLEDGSVSVPPPSEKVKDWPVLGDRAFKLWSDAAANLQTVLNRFKEQLIAIGGLVFGLVAHGATTVLQFFLSILIAGAFLLNAENGYEATCRVAKRLAGGKGQALTDLSVATIRSVAKGVLGVAIIQCVLALLLLMLWKVPAAGIWAGLVLVVAIVQLPPIVILGPVAIYVFSTAEPLSGTVFLVLAFVVSFSDTVLKPLFLGRGMETPMLVILIGAIGGAIVSGIIGLFVGAIILALGYEIFRAWVELDEPPAMTEAD